MKKSGLAESPFFVSPPPQPDNNPVAQNIYALTDAQPHERATAQLHG